uniref:Putative conserved secreted protein n=1 Tax=Rhipicephalus microplus TaxID=6941 RepID=A0A6G5A6B5_RHIMP
MTKLFVTVVLCLIYVTWNAYEAEAKPRKRRPCHHNGTTLPPGYYGAQEYPCEYWWCRRNGNVSVTKCRQPPPPRDSGYGNCKNVRYGGKWPHCCRYTRLC